MYDIDDQVTLKISTALPNYAPGSAARMSHLINAALIDQEWCRLLLSDPAAALKKGPNGEYFDLPCNLRQFVLNMRAASLAEFAEGWLKVKNCNYTTQG